MPADYGEVLRDLDAQIANLEAEIATLRSGRPTIVILRNKYAVAVELRKGEPLQNAVPLRQWAAGPYAALGPTAAIQLVLKGQQFALTTTEIVDKLKSGGLTTKGSDLSGNVSSTLSRLRNSKIVEKVGDGWKLRGSDSTASLPERTSSESGTLSLQ